MSADQDKGGLGSDQAKPRRERASNPLTIPQLERALRETIEAVAGFVALSGDEYCAGILEDRAAPLAQAYSQLASRNKAVRRFLTAMLTGSDWGQVIVLTLGTAVPIAAHHGWLPAGSWGLGSFVPPPESPEVAAHRAAREAGDQAAPVDPSPPPAGREPVPGEEAAEPAPAPPEGKVTDLGGEATRPADAGGTPS